MAGLCGRSLTATTTASLNLFHTELFHGRLNVRGKWFSVEDGTMAGSRVELMIDSFINVMNTALSSLPSIIAPSLYIKPIIRQYCVLHACLNIHEQQLYNRDAHL